MKHVFNRCKLKDKGGIMMVGVLFVCLGNICRSPMAEAVFRHLVKESGLANDIRVDSAGTASWHEGKPPHEGTREKLDELNISYEGMTARQVTADDFTMFDYIITMDEQNTTDLQRTYDINEEVVVRRLMDFVPNPQEKNVPDPYYTGDFDYTYELVVEASIRLLEHIIDNQSLKG